MIFVCILIENVKAKLMNEFEVVSKGDLKLFLFFKMN